MVDKFSAMVIMSIEKCSGAPLTQALFIFNSATINLGRHELLE